MNWILWINNKNSVAMCLVVPYRRRRTPMHLGAPTESEFEEGDCIPPQYRFYADLLICKAVYLANILYIQTGISLVEVIHQFLHQLESLVLTPALGTYATCNHSVRQVEKGNHLRDQKSRKKMS